MFKLNFIKQLLDRKLGYVLSSTVLDLDCMKRSLLLYKQFINAVLFNNLKTLIIPDSDVDGMMSALTQKMVFDAVGYTNYTVYFDNSKCHGLTDAIVRYAVLGGYDSVIIVDSSSNDLERLERLCSAGINVIVIDHHECEAVYQHKLFTIINPRIESNTVPYYEASCGAVCGALGYMYLLDKTGKVFDSFIMAGAVTLYSDTSDMSNQWNIAYVYKSQNIQNDVPLVLRLFQEGDFRFFRNFVIYRFAPRVNACIRMNRLDIVHTLFFELETSGCIAISELLKEIEVIYGQSKLLVKTLLEKSDIVNYGGYTLADLDFGIRKILNDTQEGEDIEILKGLIKTGVVPNVTGLVANTLSSETKSVGIALTSLNGYSKKGSVRDNFKRNVLRDFNCLGITAGGHPSAFGFSITNEKSEFVMCLRSFSKEWRSALANGKLDEYIFVNEQLSAEDMKILALYNEFTGNFLPSAVIVRKLVPAVKLHRSDNKIGLKFNDFWVTSFVLNLTYGDTISIEPNISSDRISYTVRNVL